MQGGGNNLGNQLARMILLGAVHGANFSGPAMAASCMILTRHPSCIHSPTPQVLLSQGAFAMLEGQWIQNEVAPGEIGSKLFAVPEDLMKEVHH